MKESLIIGYDGFYKVRSDGSVWTCRVQGRTPNRRGQWKRLKAGSNPSGHLMVILYKEKRGQCFYVHRLVLEAFVGPCPKGMEARHFPDRDPSNNNLSNLSWASKSTNQNDRAVHGTSNRGEQCANAKLTAAEVIEIRRRIQTKQGTISGIAREKQLSTSTVFDIVHRNTWKEI